MPSMGGGKTESISQLKADIQALLDSYQVSEAPTLTCLSSCACCSREAPVQPTPHLLDPFLPKASAWRSSGDLHPPSPLQTLPLPLPSPSQRCCNEASRLAALIRPPHSPPLSAAAMRHPAWQPSCAPPPNPPIPPSPPPQRCCNEASRLAVLMRLVDYLVVEAFVGSAVRTLQELHAFMQDPSRIRVRGGGGGAAQPACLTQ